MIVKRQFEKSNCLLFIDAEKGIYMIEKGIYMIEK